MVSARSDALRARPHREPVVVWMLMPECEELQMFECVELDFGSRMLWSAPN